MIVKVLSAALQGVDAFQVDLEVDLAKSGMPAFIMVGLAEGAVRESRERVFSALKNSGFKLPAARITVNLAPADRKKEGSAYDLPLALGLIAAAGILPASAAEGFFMAGELSLAGELKAVPGVLPLAILAEKSGARGLIVPSDNAEEAAVVSGLPLLVLPEELSAAVLRAVAEILPAGRPFVQFTYSKRRWERFSPRGFQAHPSRRVWLNVPPAVILPFTRAC